MCDLVFMLSRALFTDRRLKDMELSKDKSSFAGVSRSLGTMGSFPLSRVIGYAT